MKKIVFILSLLSVCSFSFADNRCFLAENNQGIIVNEGACQARYSPCSTFKIAISLMGYNEDILTDTTHPTWDYKPGYADWVEAWKKPQNPSTWMKTSCVWYSQLITEKLGMAKFKAYLAKFNYGNQDASGDKGKNNGLTHSWLSSSLQISPQEQINFLQKLHDNTLPVSVKAQALTRELLFVEELDDWKLYGKTGSGPAQYSDGSHKLKKSQGWFVGWIEKNHETLFFVYHKEYDTKIGVPASFRAKEEAINKLLELIATD